MTSAIVAALVAALSLGFVEGLGSFYPSRPTWRRLRRARGRLAVRLMRERFEAAATRRTPRVLAVVLVGLVVGWVALARLLDRHWYEILLDSLPYGIVAIALLRTPNALGRIGRRMRGYEEDVGEDPDAPLDEDEPGPELAL